MAYHCFRFSPFCPCNYGPELLLSFHMTLPFPPDDPLIEVYPVSFQTPKRPTD